MAAVVEQRIAVARAQRLDQADQDAMVAPIEDVDEAAIDEAQTVFQDGCSGDRYMRVHPAKLVMAQVHIAGEAVRDRLLIAGEDIHGEDAAVEERLMDAAGALEAEEHQRRIERDGGKGIDGDAKTPRCLIGGGDGDAGGEPTHDRTKGCRINRHALLSSVSRDAITGPVPYFPM